MRQDPVRQILERSGVLGIDDFVVFFGAVFQLDLLAFSHIFDSLFLSVSLAFVFLRNFLH